jgi:DNA polymerase
MTGQLTALRAEIGDCKRCKLCSGRNNIVFGVGSPNARLMFIGEGPGADEDMQGEPFVGRAGQLLTKIIEAMGFRRADVYITNIVMCRPPNNRNPEPDEIDECMPFLLKRISIIEPKMIVALGAVAAKALLRTEAPISKLRGKFLDWPPPGTWNLEPETLPACKLIPTYHPAFLLRNPAMKRPVWEDMQKVMKELKG